MFTDISFEFFYGCQQLVCLLFVCVCVPFIFFVFVLFFLASKGVMCTLCLTICIITYFYFYIMSSSILPLDEIQWRKKTKSEERYITAVVLTLHDCKLNCSRCCDILTKIDLQPALIVFHALFLICCSFAIISPFFVDACTIIYTKKTAATTKTFISLEIVCEYYYFFQTKTRKKSLFNLSNKDPVVRKFCCCCCCFSKWMSVVLLLMELFWNWA